MKNNWPDGVSGYWLKLKTRTRILFFPIDSIKIYINRSNHTTEPAQVIWFLFIYLLFIDCDCAILSKKKSIQKTDFRFQIAQWGSCFYEMWAVTSYISLYLFPKWKINIRNLKQKIIVFLLVNFRSLQR